MPAREQVIGRYYSNLWQALYVCVFARARACVCVSTSVSHQTFSPSNTQIQGYRLFPLIIPYSLNNCVLNWSNWIQWTLFLCLLPPSMPAALSRWAAPAHVPWTTGCMCSAWNPSGRLFLSFEDSWARWYKPAQLHPHFNHEQFFKRSCSRHKHACFTGPLWGVDEEHVLWHQTELQVQILSPACGSGQIN